MGVITTIDECLDAIEEIQHFLRSLRGLEPERIPLSKSVASNDPAITAEEAADEYLEQFTDLRSLLNSIRWPYAINPEFLCSTTSESDKNDRADGIIEALLGRSIRGVRFLDFGCGEGHVVLRALAHRADYAAGFDIQAHDQAMPWKDQDRFFTDFGKLSQQPPFNLILLNDVLDHVVNEDPVEVLKRVKSLLANDGTVVIRFHPWVSRHGGHLYHQKNKAFAHLVFDEQELQKLGISVVPMQKMIDPKRTYISWIKAAKFNIVKEDLGIVKVEDFFLESDLVRSRLNRVMGRRDSQEIPVSVLEQCFLDYTLKR